MVVQALVDGPLPAHERAAKVESLVVQPRRAHRRL